MLVLHFSIEEEDILEHAIGKCHLRTLSSTCKPLCNIGMHLVRLLDMLMPSVTTRKLW